MYGRWVVCRSPRRCSCIRNERPASNRSIYVRVRLSDYWNRFPRLKETPLEPNNRCFYTCVSTRDSAHSHVTDRLILYTYIILYEYR
jgi:hypothetical protein